MGTREPSRSHVTYWDTRRVICYRRQTDGQGTPRRSAVCFHLLRAYQEPLFLFAQPHCHAIHRDNACSSQLALGDRENPDVAKVSARCTASKGATRNSGVLYINAFRTPQ